MKLPLDQFRLLSALALLTLLSIGGCSKSVKLGRYVAPDETSVEILPDNRLSQIGKGVSSSTEYKISGDKLMLKVPGDWVAGYKVEGSALIELGKRRRYDWIVPAAEKYRQAAEGGDANAQTRLGICYSAGTEGVYQDRSEAERWWKKAADQGESSAEMNLASLYASSSDPKFWDGKKAVEYAERSLAHSSKELSPYHNYHVIAAAHARNGDFEKAVEMETEAIELITTAKINQEYARAELLPDFQKALESFKRGKPLPDKPAH